MANEGGTWIMRGLDWDNPYRMNSYKVLNDRKALEVIFNWMNLETLTNPECSLVSEHSPLSRSLTFSRDTGTLPISCDDFCHKVLSSDWEVIMCVAGTEETDTRRVALLYIRAERSFLFNFPLSEKLTQNEKAIKEWILQAVR